MKITLTDSEWVDILEAADRQRGSQEMESKLAQGKPTHSLELDIRLTPEIVRKVRESDLYAQNLYAAMCNVIWQEHDVWEVLRDQHWQCTWRYAGSIISGIREQGSYLDWYCSGMEGTVTDEILQDLAAIGWRPIENEDDNQA